MGKSIRFDEDGFPIPDTVKVPKQTIQFDEEGLPVPVKKKGGGLSAFSGVSKAVSQNGGTVGSSNRQSERSDVLNYLQSLKEKPKQGVLMQPGLTQVTGKEKYDTDKVRKEAVHNIYDVMYAEGDEWKDPVKSLYQRQAKKSPIPQGKDLLLQQEQDKIIDQSLMPDGYEALRLINTSEWGKGGPDNLTSNRLRKRADEYVAATEPLRSLNGNQPWALGYVGEERIVDKKPFYDALIDIYAKKNPAFAQSMQAAGGRPNIETNATRGMIASMALNDPDVIAYITKEDKSLLRPAQIVANDMYFDNPDFGKADIANRISRKLQQDGYNNIDPIFNFAGENAKKAADLTAQEILSGKEAEFYNKNKDEIFGMLDMPSLAEGFASGGKSFFQGIGSSFTEPFKSTSQSIRDYWEEEAKNVSSNPEGFVKFMRDSGHALGFVSAMVATGNAVGSGTLLNPATANSILISTSFLGDNLKQARQKFPDSPVKQWTSALTNTALFALAGRNIFPAARVEAAINGVKPEINSMVSELASGKITKEAFRDKTTNLASKIVDDLSTGMTKNAKASAEMAGISLVNQGLDKILGISDENYDKFHQQGEVTDVAKNFFLSNIFVNQLAAMGERNRKNEYAKESYYSAASNPKYAERMIIQLEETDPTVDVKDMRANLAYVADLKQKLDSEGVSVKKQKEFIYNSLISRKAAELAQTTPDANFNSRYANMANSLLRENESIINETQKEKEIVQNSENDIDVLREFYDNDLIGKGSKDMLTGSDGKFSESNADEYLKFIAQQSNNLNDKWEPNKGNAPSMDEVPYTVIEMANRKFKDEIEAADKKELDKIKTEEKEKPINEGEYVGYLEFENPKNLSEAADNVVKSEYFNKSKITGVGSSGGVYIDDLIRISDHKPGRGYDPSKLDIGTHQSADIKLDKWSDINDLIPKIKKYIDEFLNFERWEDENGFEPDGPDKKAELIKEIFYPKKGEVKTEENAIQEPRTDALDVRQQADYGKGVGEGNTQPEVIAGEKEKGKVEGEEKVKESGGDVTKPTFDNVPIETRTPEEIEKAKNEVFNNTSVLPVGRVITNSDGQIKVVTDNSVSKNGTHTIGIVTFERQKDGSLIQVTNQSWVTKKADGKINTDYNPHETGTNSEGKRVTMSDKITNKNIDLSKEKIFVYDENGNLVESQSWKSFKPKEQFKQTSNKPTQETPVKEIGEQKVKVEGEEKVKPLTKSQKEDLLDRIDLRIDTITEDPESATDFETEENLNALKSKIESGKTSFTKNEINWIKEEVKPIEEASSESGKGAEPPEPPKETVKPAPDRPEGDPFKEDKLDRLANNVEDTGKVAKYLSGETIEKYTGEEPQNDQTRGVQELEIALNHGEKIIEEAKNVFGDDYVEKTLKYIERSKAGVSNKALMYVSLENALGKEKLANPENAAEIAKLQKLVYEKSQAFARESSLALNYQKLRRIAKVGYDLNKVTDAFFSKEELVAKGALEKAVEANPDIINEQYAFQETGAITPEIEKMIKEGIEKEVAKIYEALPKEKKSAADRAIAALEKAQAKLRNKTYDAGLGILVAIIDANITVIKNAIKAGVTISKAIELGIEKIKEKYGKELEKEREDNIRKYFTDVFDKIKSAKEVTKDALIEKGFGREIEVKGEKKQILDWKKLAGAAGTVSKISENVGAVLKEKGYSEKEIENIKNEFINEYIDLRASVIEKAQNELAKRNKVAVTPNQKSAAKKLSELYTYGLFDSKYDEYENTLNKALGAKVSEQGFKDAKKIARAMENIYGQSFKGIRLNEISAKSALEKLEDEIRVLLYRESRAQGNANLKIANIVRSFMDVSQTMLLNNLKQAVENPLSGKQQELLDTFDNLINSSSNKELRQRQRSARRNLYKDIVLNGGVPYGKIESQFVNRQHLDDLVNNVSDSKMYHGVASVLTGKATLNAIDAKYKLSITEKKFAKNLIRVLTDKTNPNRISKEEALKFVSEKLTGQTYKEAQETAKIVIEKINEDAGTELIKTEETQINRLANDIVKASLEMGNKLTAEQISAAYNAAYKAAGLGLGHEANNFLSQGLKGVSAKMEGDINRAIKEKKWNKAALLTYSSILFRNVLNPFVGGGTNWIVLKMQKTGLGLFTGLFYHAGAEKLDLSTPLGNKRAERALYEQARYKDQYMRGVIGGIVSLAGYLLYKGLVSDDDYRKWRKGNPWAARYVDVITPEVLLAEMGVKDENFKGYIEKSLNRGDAFDLMKKVVKSVKYFLKGENGKGWGALGEVAGVHLNPPLPWRLVKDVQVLYQGVTGQDPYHGNYKPSNGFLSGVLQGGALEYFGVPRSVDENAGNKTFKIKRTEKAKKRREKRNSND